MNPQSLLNQAFTFHQNGQLAEAERLYLQILAGEAGNFAPRYLLGVLRAQQGRYAEALELIDSALRIAPDVPEALANRANILMALSRPADALASYDRLLLLKPDDAAALNNRGNALSELERLEEALMSYDRALAIQPENPEALNNRGNALRALGCLEEAMASYERALAINPSYLEALYNRGLALKGLNRLEEALSSYDQTLAMVPDFVPALSSRGIALRELNRIDEAEENLRKALSREPTRIEALNNLCTILYEKGQVPEALLAFRNYAELQYGPSGTMLQSEGDRPFKIKHDQEQLEYLGKTAGDAGRHLTFRLENGARLPTPAVNPQNADPAIAARWRAAEPQIMVIDNVLTPAALTGLQRFCRESTIWRKSYDGGYLGASPEYGFACPLLAQIADEFRAVLPGIFESYPLQYLWAFKYDSDLKGINIHADFAAVNVNFWITPDEANLDPESGGLVIWDVATPPDWDFNKYNTDERAIRDFLAKNQARPVTVPYRSNRAVIFNSDLFHETDRINFREGYLNRRINITLLYGRRQNSV